MTGAWIKPQRCDNSGPNCVEVNELPTGERIVRNSQRPEITVKFDAQEWEAFTASVRDGQF